MYQVVKFLMIEDNPGDIRLTQEFFKKCKLLNPLNIATNAVDALQYISTSPPDIILISMRLLLIKDFQFLNEIKNNNDGILIIALTGIEGEETIHSTNLPIDLFCMKPLSIESLTTIVQYGSEFLFLLMTDEAINA